MASIGDTTRPEYIYDQATDTWIPVGIGPHSHTPAAIGAIASSLVTAKGDLIVGTSSGVVVAQPVGANNQVLMADSAQTDGVKWANEATATLTTTGDILYASAANTPTRLGIGSSGQILSVSGGVPAWTTLSSGAYTSLASGSLSSGALALTSISGSYRDIVLILENWQVASAIRPTFTVNQSSSNTAYGLVQTWANATAGTGVAQIASNSTSFWIAPFTAWTGSNGNVTIITFKNYASTSSRKYGTVEGVQYANVSQAATTHMGNLFFDQTSAITRLDFAGSQFSAGSYVLYGVK